MQATKTVTTVVLSLAFSSMLAACDGGNTLSEPSAEKKPTLQQMRWYSSEQVALGEKIYQANCASCHGTDASGDPNWREPDASGKFPPPPLNGSGHAWHHPKNMLRMTIRRGGIPLGGSMPPFGDKLSSEEVDAVIAWFQSHWNDEIYSAWARRNAQAAIAIGGKK